MLRRHKELNDESASISQEQYEAEQERREISRLEVINPRDGQLAPRKAKLDERFKKLGRRGTLLGNARSALAHDIAVAHKSRTQGVEIQRDQGSPPGRLLAQILTSTTPQTQPDSKRQQSAASVAHGQWLQSYMCPPNTPLVNTPSHPRNASITSNSIPHASYSSSPTLVSCFAGQQPLSQQIHGAPASFSAPPTGPALTAFSWQNQASAVNAPHIFPFTEALKRFSHPIPQVEANFQPHNAGPSQANSQYHPNVLQRQIYPPPSMDPRTRQQLYDTQRAVRENQRMKHLEDGRYMPFHVPFLQLTKLESDHDLIHKNYSFKREDQELGKHSDTGNGTYFSVRTIGDGWLDGRS